MLLHKDIANKDTKKEEGRGERRKKWIKRRRKGGKEGENKSPASANVFRTPVTEKSREKALLISAYQDTLGFNV